jgi:hypothetical protein
MRTADKQRESDQVKCLITKYSIIIPTIKYSIMISTTKIHALRVKVHCLINFSLPL